MTLTRPLAVLAFLTAAFHAGLAGAQDTPQVPPEAREAAQRSNAFGLDLYRELAKREGNLCFSPYSISAAMGMAYQGAKGETRRQIQEALHFGDGVAESQGALDRALAGGPPTPTQGQTVPAAAGDGMAQVVNPSAPKGSTQEGKSAPGQPSQPTHVVRVANRAWPQLGYPIKPSYLEALAPYGVGIEPLDFAQDPDEAKDTINAWVAEKTKDAAGEPMIPELLAELDDTTRLVLTNAIYFRGEWKSAFDPQQTRQGIFTKQGGDRVLVPMMHRSETVLRVGSLPSGAEIARLPYMADGADLVVVLPAENTAAGMAAAGAELGQVDAALAAGYELKHDLSFPKFAVEASLELKGALQGLGVVDAFDPLEADLRGIAESPAGENELLISKVVHKAAASFDEAGAQAAAATAVVIGAESMSMTPRFSVDRPFLFLIRDTQTGAVLFMGRVMDPSEK